MACERAARTGAIPPRCLTTWRAQQVGTPNAAYEYGALIGRELRAQGYNMSLGGGVEPHPRTAQRAQLRISGRRSDPRRKDSRPSLLKALQAQHVIGDIKHYALNNQESGRNAVNVNIDERSMRETDLLAFEIGIRTATPPA